MPAGRVTDVKVVAAACVLIALLTGVGVVVAPAPDGPNVGSSSFSAGPDGSKAAYLTLRELGYDIHRSFEPLTAIKGPPAKTVLVLTGPQQPSDQDRRAFRRFIEDGGVALVVGDAGTRLLDAARAPGGKAPVPPFELQRSEPRTFAALVPSPFTRGAPRITMAPDIAPPRFDGTLVALYGDSPDLPVVVTAASGNGRIAWWAAATPVTNRHVAAADNLEFLLNTVGAAGERRILWDEYYHGHHRSFWSYVAGTPLPWIALQCGLIMFAALLTFSRRHGPVRARAVDPRTSPMEFVEMLGALYQRAGSRAAGVSAALARFRRTVAVTCGLPAGRPDTELARAAAARLRLDSSRVEDLLNDATRAAQEPALDKSHALDVIRRLQGMTASLRARIH